MQKNRMLLIVLMTLSISIGVAVVLYLSQVNGGTPGPFTRTYEQLANLGGYAIPVVGMLCVCFFMTVSFPAPKLFPRSKFWLTLAIWLIPLLTLVLIFLTDLNVYAIFHVSNHSWGVLFIKTLGIVCAIAWVILARHYLGKHSWYVIYRAQHSGGGGQ